jgi:hypothetical protein
MIKILIGLIFIIINLNANDKNNAKNSGSIAGQSAISKYGSKSGIQTNVTPLQTGGTLTSIDGKSTFNAKIGGCAENNEAIKIVFYPKSNNVLDINLNQDLEASGTYNYSYNIQNVTTICTAGVRLTNGKYYKFDFNKFSKQISIREVVQSESGYCFCILDSCNYGGYRKDIADKVVGDLVGVIGSSGISNYQAGINNYNEIQKTYYMYVRNEQSCNDSNVGNHYTGINPTAYYESQVVNPISIEDVAMKDGNKSDSLYYITGNLDSTVISSSNNNSLHNIKIKNEQVCTIKKKPYLDDNGNIKIKIEDGCIANYSCPLHREEICDDSGRNCIDRILNKVSTSYNIPLQCKSFNDEFQICADGNNISTLSNYGAENNVIYSSLGESYFYAKRYYDCGTQTITHDSSKTNNTLSSVDKSGSTINYTDFDGNPQNIYLGEFDNCQVRNCRVKINTKHTQVYTDGTSNASTKDGVSTVEYEFKKCNQLANQSYICPLESGETLLDDCSCNIGMGAASMAIGYASAIEDAVKDFTCSSN